MSYTNISNGWVNHNEHREENEKLPTFTGLLEISELARIGDKIQIALWPRTDRDGKPCFSVKLSRKEDE
jgi:hypothetical protein